MQIEISNHAKQLRISNLRFPRRLLTVLTRMGCVTLGDLHGKRLDEIRETPACGSKTIADFRSALKKKSLGRLIESDQEESRINPIDSLQPGFSIPNSARGWPISALPMSVRL